MLTFGCLWYRMATQIGISRKAKQTFTIWLMIQSIAFGIMATHTRTGIHTFVVDTGFGSRTIGVQNTFWSTFNVWITKVLGYAFTRSRKITFLA